MVATLYSYELNWIHNYDEALIQAQKEQKNVYLFIGADNCRFCERFKDLTLSKKRCYGYFKRRLYTFISQ